MLKHSIFLIHKSKNNMEISKKITKEIFDEFIKSNYNLLLHKINNNPSFFYVILKEKNTAHNILIDTYIHILENIEKSNIISKILNMEDTENKIKYFIQTAKNLIIDKYRKNKIVKIDEPDDSINNLFFEQKFNEGFLENEILEDKVKDNESLFKSFFLCLENIKNNSKEKKRFKRIFINEYKPQIEKFIINPDYFLSLDIENRYKLEKKIKKFINLSSTNQ